MKNFLIFSNTIGETIEVREFNSLEACMENKIHNQYEFQGEIVFVPIWDLKTLFALYWSYKPKGNKKLSAYKKADHISYNWV